MCLAPFPGQKINFTQVMFPFTLKYPLGVLFSETCGVIQLSLSPLSRSEERRTTQVPRHAILLAFAAETYSTIP